MRWGRVFLLTLAPLALAAVAWADDTGTMTSTFFDGTVVTSSYQQVQFGYQYTYQLSNVPFGVSDMFTLPAPAGWVCSNSGNAGIRCQGSFVGDSTGSDIPVTPAPSPSQVAFITEAVEPNDGMTVPFGVTPFGPPTLQIAELFEESLARLSPQTNCACGWSKESLNQTLARSGSLPNA